MAKSKNESINISIFTALKVSEKSKVPVLIMSNPGLGKSTTVSMFAEVRGYKLQLLRGNSTTAEEVLGYDVADQSEESKTTKHLRPSWFTNVLNNDEKGLPTLLFLDEITTANEFVQSALLHLIFERMVGDEKLPESTLIVSAGNYSQNLSNQMNLLPPLMNRFMIYNIIPTVDDLDTFLCKFKGALISKEGQPENYMNQLRQQMVDLDSQELTVDEKTYNKIGEYVERGIYSITRMLMTSGEKPVDLSVRDLQGIYSDINDNLGNKLYGFVTFRTLNYLRDVTISMYLCFGKAGITSDNYRNMIDGLCGIGVNSKKDRNGNMETKTNLISKEIYDMMLSTVNDIEKMSNSKLTEYENFFNSLVTEKLFDVPKMQAIINKIEELRNDKGVENIDRPIDPDTIKSICKIIKSTGSNIQKVKLDSSVAKVSDVISTESFISMATQWNTIADLITNVKNLVTGLNTGYKDDTKSEVQKTIDDLKNGGFKLRSVRKLITVDDPSLGSIIPEIKSFN